MIIVTSYKTDNSITYGMTSDYECIAAIYIIDVQGLVCMGLLTTDHLRKHFKGVEFMMLSWPSMALSWICNSIIIVYMASVIVIIFQ